MPDYHTYRAAEERLVSYLKENKMRCTQERLIILSHITSLGRHFTAEQLVKDLCEIQHISTGTIYNNLALFCDAHIIRILPHRKQYGAEYELCLSDENSLRFICTRCGREVEFKNKVIEHLLNESRFSNFNMDNFSLVVYGNCKTCRKKRK